MDSVMKELRGAMPPRIFGLESPLGLTWSKSGEIGRLNKNRVCSNTSNTFLFDLHFYYLRQVNGVNVGDIVFIRCVCVCICLCVQRIGQ